MNDRTEQGRALVVEMRSAGWWEHLSSETRRDAADTLSWALDRIAALEGALREAHGAISIAAGTASNLGMHVTAGMHAELAKSLQRLLTPQPVKEDA